MATFFGSFRKGHYQNKSQNDQKTLEASLRCCELKKACSTIHWLTTNLSKWRVRFPDISTEFIDNYLALKVFYFDKADQNEHGQISSYGIDL